ncbi:PaaI family thioesterase [Dongshaea marina]|uniref:PaaI family thioesterase n=1 Tax=Dongshaea marina TaxID=2047966 RepID=UPI00131F4179|nr:PaaI family thioesterase [Dongshaea marina]
MPDSATSYQQCCDSHQNCLICGDANPASLRLNFSLLGDGSVHTLFHPSEILQGYPQQLHGGIVSSLLDSAMVHCLFHQGIQAVTADMKIRFVSPILVNSEVEVMGQLISTRRNIFDMRADIRLEGKTHAWASAKFVRLRK